MCDLDSDVVGSSKDNQWIQPKPKTQLSSKGRPVRRRESIKRWVLTSTHVEDQRSTGRPVLVDQKEEHEIDFRVPGLSHAVVREAEHLRVQELLKMNENHPHREALLADLWHDNVHNPFSNNWKEMICEMGDVELVVRVVRNHTHKYNVLIVFFIGIKELCTAFADNAWLTANPEESLTNLDCMHSLSRTAWSRKDLSWCSTWQNQKTNRAP